MLIRQHDYCTSVPWGGSNHYYSSNNLEHCLTHDGCSLDSSSSVRNLGVLFDSNLYFDSHVSSICKTAFFFHLKNISKFRPMLSMSKKIDIYANIILFLSYSEVTVATRSGPYPAQMITAVNRSSPYPDQMIDQHLETTSTALNVSGDQDT